MYDVHVVFLSKQVKYFQFDQNLLKDKLTCSYEFLENGFDIKSWVIRKNVYSLINSFNPDIVVTHEFAFQTFQLMFYKLFNKKIKHLIWTADNVEMILWASRLNAFRRKIGLKLADGVSVYTKDVKDLYQSKFNVPENTIGLYPNVQNEIERTKRLRELKLFSKEIMQEWIDKNVILYVGRIDPEKNLFFLIDSFRKAKKMGLEAILLIVGDGKLILSLKEYIGSEKEEILCVGKVEGDLLQEYYLVADLFVLPSYHEPFGAVVNEALMAGTPVFCSNKAGAKDLIIPKVNGGIIELEKGADHLGGMLFNFFKDIKVRDKYLVRDSLMGKSFFEYIKHWLPNSLVK